MGKYVPSTSEEQQEMLKAVGVSSFDELYTVVPSGMKVDRLAIPEGKSELESAESSGPWQLRIRYTAPFSAGQAL